MLMKKKYFIIFLVILLLFIIWNLQKSSKSNSVLAENRAAVAVMTVFKSSVAITLKSIGTATSNESVDIMSNVTQIVSSVHFNDCEYVKKGQLLVQLNIDRKIAEKKQMEINLLEQQRELNRLKILREKKVVPEKDYDIQKTKLLDAQAKLDGINADIKESSIAAPFDGVLGIRKVSVGALLTPSSIITTIDDIDKIKVDFTLPEKYILLLVPNLKITARCAALAEKKFDGYILAIEPRISAASRSISMRGVIANREHLLKPGMMLKITIRLKNREAICIPEKALSSIGEKHYVFILSDSARAKLRYVTIGERENGFVEIEKGLNSGDKIITEGVNKLSDNNLVTIVKDDTIELMQAMSKHGSGKNKGEYQQDSAL
ncbi:MAG: efflux RND transporter periplasmic adaptor subunit [Holosporaceae bacterium]|jgi:membrane fusion protein (multidrug efflux system)|nr:efflux RND transporter periplasmic adaptor subunit [Holosporaceae bacterium]